MVRLLAQEKKLPEAEKHLVSLKKELPESPEVMELEGWFAMQQRKPKNAAAAFASALEKAPSSRAVVSLAQAQWAAGDRDKAMTTLAEWTNRYPKDGYVRYMKAGLLGSIGRTEDARKELQMILETQPDNVFALNDLAWMLRKENPTLALEYAEKAVSRAPKSAAFLDTLAMILLETNQPDRALNLMQQAYTYARKNPEIRYHLALAYAKSGRTEDARKVLTELLGDEADFKGRAEAEQFLKSLKISAK